MKTMFLYIGLGFLICSLSACPSSDPSFQAREKLQKLGASFTAEEFVRRVLLNDQLAVGLFLDAGMDPNTEGDVVAYFKEIKVVTEDQDPIVMPVLLVAQQRRYVEIAEMLVNSGARQDKVELAKRRISSQVDPNKIKYSAGDGSKRTPEDQEFINQIRRKFKQSEDSYEKQVEKFSNSLERAK